jgi:hypothetical protein
MFILPVTKDFKNPNIMRIHTYPDPAFKSGSTTVKINRDLIKQLKLRKQIPRNIEEDLGCSIENQYLGCVESSNDVNTGLLSSRSSLHMVIVTDHNVRIVLGAQCCGSGSRIRCLFDPWIRDPGWVKSQDPDPG